MPASTHKCIGPHEWMGNPEILMSGLSGEDTEGIPPYTCRSCAAVGEDCPECDGSGGSQLLDADPAYGLLVERCAACKGTGIAERREVAA
jgi:hypothetical protein